MEKKRAEDIAAFDKLECGVLNTSVGKWFGFWWFDDLGSDRDCSSSTR